MKVNFEIVSVDLQSAQIYVKYWADDESKDRFNCGPYTIPLDPRVYSMTNVELLEWVARFGVPIVRSQLNVIESEENGTVLRMKFLYDKPQQVELEDV